jgi:Ca2+-binding RTX toxin-like protein
MPTGPSSSASPYVLSTAPGVSFTSILTVGDSVNLKPDGTPYRMVGIPDGLGAFDNGDGTFTLLMNQEIGNTVGITRAHGAKGSFVSSWTINKSDLSVVNGSDLIQRVYNWNTTTQSLDTTTPITLAFNRFCSADLPDVTAYYNPATGLGSQARIFMHGEEGGATGYQVATVATGADKGSAYILGKFNLSTNGSGLTGVGAWENAVANPFPQNKTVVAANNDGGTGIMSNSVSVYVGTKTNSGTEVDKAGLTNGTLKFVNVTGSPVEIVNSTTRATNITNGTRFSLSSTASTTFSRPEDGAWNPLNPSQYFFVTTDRLDQVSDGIGTQVGNTRLWSLTFDDITNPDLGGKVDLLIDGDTVNGVKVNMFDNLAVDKYGHITLQEDVGNAAHNGKIWQYDIASDTLTQIGKHDPARFGDIGVPATLPFNQDEETSGVMDAQDILSPGWFFLDDQAHYTTSPPITPELVEGGQLLALYNPTTYNSFYATLSTIAGTSGRDTITGTASGEKILGGIGGDTLTGGAGSDAFVYTNIRDSGDVIKDFTVRQDRIALADLLDGIVSGGYTGSDAIADGYVKFIGSGSNTILQIDQDGNGTAASPRNFLTVENVSVAALSATSNFVF